jgi:transposase
MISAGFLDPESRKDLTELARDGSAAHRLARRANALVLLDDGMSCVDVARVLLLDDDTVRTWHRLYEEDGIEGLVSFGCDGSACRLSDAQQAKLKAWITETLPRTTREVGAWIEAECGITYESRSGLIALLHRLGMEHRKPKAVSSKLDPDKQAAFIKAYNDLLNHMGDDEAVLFGDAVHPTHAVRPVGCWAPKDIQCLFVDVRRSDPRRRGALGADRENRRFPDSPRIGLVRAGLSKRLSAAIVMSGYFALSAFTLVWLGLNTTGLIAVFGMLLPLVVAIWATMTSAQPGT